MTAGEPKVCITDKAAEFADIDKQKPDGSLSRSKHKDGRFNIKRPFFGEGIYVVNNVVEFEYEITGIPDDILTSCKFELRRKSHDTPPHVFEICEHRGTLQWEGYTPATKGPSFESFILDLIDKEGDLVCYHGVQVMCVMPQGDQQSSRLEIVRAAAKMSSMNPPLFGGAKRLLEAGKQHFGDCGPILYQLACIEAMQGNTKAALEYLQKATTHEDFRTLATSGQLKIESFRNISEMNPSAFVKVYNLLSPYLFDELYHFHTRLVAMVQRGLQHNAVGQDGFPCDGCGKTDIKGSIKQCFTCIEYFWCGCPNGCTAHEGHDFQSMDLESGIKTLLHAELRDKVDMHKLQDHPERLEQFERLCVSADHAITAIKQRNTKWKNAVAPFELPLPLRETLEKHIGTSQIRVVSPDDDVLRGIFDVNEIPLPEGLRIKHVLLVYNENLSNAFGNYIIDAEARRGCAEYQPSDEVFGGEKQRVLQEWRRRVDRSNVVEEKKRSSGVHVMRAWHGTHMDAAMSIAAHGAGAFGKLSDGWYGKGVYSSTNVDYAMVWTRWRDRPALVLHYAVVCNPYPVTVDDAKDRGQLKLYGKGATGNHDCHYALVVRRDSGEYDYLPPEEPPSDAEVHGMYDEIVLFQEAAFLPRLVVELEKVAA